MTSHFAVSPLTLIKDWQMCSLLLICFPVFFTSFCREETISIHPTTTYSFTTTKTQKPNVVIASKFGALYANCSWHSQNWEGNALALCFWKDEANFRIQFSKGNAMFVSSQPLLRSGKKSQTKQKTVGLTGYFQAKQRADGEPFRGPSALSCLLQLLWKQLSKADPLLNENSFSFPFSLSLSLPLSPSSPTTTTTTLSHTHMCVHTHTFPNVYLNNVIFKIWAGLSHGQVAWLP